MTRFKEIFAGLRSCFALTAHERLIIMLVLALFLFGLFFRWRHLIREHADPDPYESRDEPLTGPSAPARQIMPSVSGER